MTRASRITLLVFSASVIAVLTLLTFLTARTLRLERDELRAKTDAAQQEALRLALWRMDSAVAPIIAQEAARPYFHYLSYYPEQRAFTRVWEPVRPGEVLVPSPLVQGTPPFILLHFQVHADGRLTSPQVPQGNDRDLAESEPGGAERVEHYEKLLASLSGLSLDARADAKERGPGRASRGGASGAPSRAEALDQRADALPRAETSGPIDEAEREYGYRKEAAEIASRPAPVIGQTLQSQSATPPDRSPSESAARAIEETGVVSAGIDEPIDDAERSFADAPSIGSMPGVFDAAAMLDDTEQDPSSPDRADRERQSPTIGRRANMLGIPSARDGLAPPPSRFIPRATSRFAQLPVDRPDLSQSAFVPRWRKARNEDTPELLIWRSVRAESSVGLQGFWIDWPALERHLLSRVGDVLPGASIVPVLGTEGADPASSSRRLASIPAMVVPPPAPSVPMALLSPSHVTLFLTWIFTIVAVGAVGASLRASIALSERRAKFVSAVTHELRTPLTTFVLYSQMLADGMVPEGEASRAYLSTLRSEATRLQRIVENVLEFARLGRAVARKSNADAVAVSDILNQALPTLQQRAAQAGMSLEVSVDDSAGRIGVRTSPDAVARVLTNLVDNACKYASDAEDKRISIRVGAASGRVVFRVRDHGPGVPASERRRIFLAFARGKSHESSPTQGLGLGLSLARAIARQHGGDLRLDRSTNGASFTLWLPQADERDRT